MVPSILFFPTRRTSENFQKTAIFKFFNAIKLDSLHSVHRDLSKEMIPLRASRVSTIWRDSHCRQETLRESSSPEIRNLTIVAPRSLHSRTVSARRTCKRAHAYAYTHARTYCMHRYAHAHTHSVCVSALFWAGELWIWDLHVKNCRCYMCTSTCVDVCACVCVSACVCTC